jgi:CBS domain containing-hemolysin-like protein
VLLAVVTGRSGITLASLATLLGCVAVYIIICEHLLPSIIVRRNPEAVLAVLLPPFTIVAGAMSPISGLLVRLLASGKPERSMEALDRDEDDAGEVTHAYLEAGEEQGLIERDEKRLLQSIVDFGDTLAREVMTPRPDIVAVQGSASVAELRALFREQEYSRFPVYNENLDNIAGIIRVKDLLQIDDAAIDRHPITSLVRPATFVPETKRVPELLKEFQRKQVQMAIVVDEYGGTAGLVTIEDLLEEIVGEIRDEDDVESEPIVDEGNGSYVFSAKVSFDELRERLDLEIEPEGFETVGGYILARAGRVPAVGESFDVDGLHVEVLEAERRRIHKVRFRKAASVASRVPDSASR